MIQFDSKETEIVAYDCYTNLKHSSYHNVGLAAKSFKIKGIEIRQSIREESPTRSGHYFKIEPRKSYKNKMRGGRVLIGKIKSI